MPNDPYGLLASGLPPEIASQAQGLSSRDAILKALMQQSMQPIEAPQVKGRFQGRVDPLQGVAKVLQAYMSGKGIEQSQSDWGGLREKLRSGQESAADKYSSIRTGLPEIPQPSPDFGGGPGRPSIPGDPRAALEYGMKNPYLSGNPLLKADLAAWEKSNEPRVLGRSMVIPATGEVVGVDPTFAQEKEADRKAKEEAARAAAQDKQDLAKLTASLRPEKVPTASTEVLDPADPTRLLRIQPGVYKQGTTLGAPGVLGIAGKEPVAAKRDEKVNSGRETVSSLVDSIKENYRKLGKSGGIVDPASSGAANLGAAIGSSAPGQFVGGVLGTENQSIRNEILQARPLLLNAIKEATGMSAKQMDSNAELKLYLSASTDPKLDIRANLAALDKIDELYGLSKKKPGAPSSPASSSPDIEKLLEKYR